MSKSAQKLIAREFDAGNLYDITAINNPADRLAATQADNATRQRLKDELKLTTQQLNKLISAELRKRRS